MILFPNDLLYWPNPLLLKISITVYLIGLISWLIYEIKIWNVGELNRVSYVALTAILNGVCFCLGQNELEILFPLIAYHGTAYFGVMSLSLSRTKQKFPWRRALALTLATALVFGYYEKVIEFFPNRVSIFWESIWAGIYVTPIMLHYIYDTVIWTSNHPDAKKIYGAMTKPALKPAYMKYEN